MTTAREQAREAVQQCYSKFPEHGYIGSRKEISIKFADAASDPWEEIVKELKRYIEREIYEYGENDYMSSALACVQEALGD